AADPPGSAAGTLPGASRRARPRAGPAAGAGPHRLRAADHRSAARPRAARLPRAPPGGEPGALMGGLGFLVPAFLAGFAALLVPLLIHLRHREWEKPRRFPSLMFLRRIPIRTARRRRITDWLLLLLRAAVFAALVAAFARP